MQKNFVQLLFIHLSLIGTLFAFQNCGQSFESQKIETLNLPSEDGALGDPPDDQNPDPENPPIPSVCNNGDTQFGYLVESALTPATCGNLIIKNCVDGQWDREETIFPFCQQMCLHPQTQQAVVAGTMYFSFTTAQATTQALCDAARVTSTCSQQTGLFSPAPAANASCMVQGQTCAYTTGAGISNPTGNMTGASVTGFATQSATSPDLCGSQVTRTCQASGNWSGSTPLYTSCQQMCRHPDNNNQPVNQNTSYVYYTRQSGSEAECQAARMTSTCQASTGLFNPAPAQTRFQSCTVTAPPPPPGDGIVTARLSATRLSGPAPLAVLFDATSTTATGIALPFHRLRYEFNFGDDRGLTWAYSSLAKNTQIGGPLASHVFDNPGTYTVRLRARDPVSNDTSDATVTITVQDPASVYSSANTTCVSTSASYTGCPAGAVRQTSLPTSYANKRVLLRRGESFGPINIGRADDGARLEPFGTGIKPTVERVFINASPLNTGFADNITIMDLNVLNGIGHSDSGSRYLIYRNDLINPGGNNSIEIGGALGYMYEQNRSLPFYNPYEIFVIENRVIGQVNRNQNPFMNMTGMGSRFVVMGNEMMRAEEHTMRFFALHKSIVAHNAIRGYSWGGGADGSGASIRGCMKIHSGGLSPYSDAYSVTEGRWATSQLIVANNLFGDANNNGQFIAGVGSQNRDVGTTEGNEDVIIENNRFTRGPHGVAEMENTARRLTTRGNVRTDGGPIALSIAPQAPSLPDEWYGPFFQE